MPNAYVSLIDFREKALQALNMYRIAKYGQAEPIPDDEVRTVNDIPMEDRKTYLSHVPTATNERYDYVKIWGPLMDIRDVIENASSVTDGYLKVAEHAQANRLQYIAWMAYCYNVSQALNTYNVSIDDYNMSIEPTEREYNGIINIEAFLNALVMSYPTLDDVMRGKRKYDTHVSRYLDAHKRNLRNQGISTDTKFARMLADGPKIASYDRSTIEEQLSELIKSLPSNGLTSRTWGFEVEVPDAKEVEPLPNSGIEKGEDGSLRSYESSEDCECDCDDCYYHDCDCELCDTGSSDPEHCGNNSCASCDSAEFRTTGGIQRVKHNGLYDLCKKLNDVDAEMNDTAGTHIHVFAADLTTNQVGQVFGIYKRLENIFGVIAGRVDNGYSKAIPTDYVRFLMRKSNPTVPLDKPRAINASHLFNDRGTLEFRQMDCNLDADRITAWAWLMRGLVESTKRGAKLQDFMTVTDLKGIVETFARYNFFAHDENPGLIIPGTRTDKDLVKRTVFQAQ